MENSIYHSDLLYNCFKKLNLCRIFPQTTMKHIMAILKSVFSLEYHGKTIDFEKYSPCHRTTVAHFLNKGKWDDTHWKIYSKILLSSLSIRKPSCLESPYSALWTIPSLLKQSLRHGPCIRLKMRIFISPT